MKNRDLKLDGKEYYGDRRVHEYLQYNKKEKSRCIYCSDEADSREHLPSRVFFDEPYPENLIICPSCLKCNNSFSKDEEFVACLIEHISKIYDSPIKREKILKAMLRSRSLKAQVEKSINKNGFLTQESCARIERVVRKIIIGHFVYENSSFDDFEIRFDFISNLSDEQILNFNAPIKMDLISEIGARNTLLYINEADGSLITLWETIQANNYRYLVTPSIVKIVISETLYELSN